MNRHVYNICWSTSHLQISHSEFYCNPAFLSNKNELKLGTMQEGEVVNDVALPPWANGSPEKFVEVMRIALESDIVSDTLPSWIDLIFGYKQQGKHAIEAHNGKSCSHLFLLEYTNSSNRVMSASVFLLDLLWIGRCSKY